MKDVLVKLQNVSKSFFKNYKTSASEGIKKAILTLMNKAPQHIATVKSDGFLALDCVSLEISRGEVVGLLGKNGAGKSTLLKHIGGIYLPDEGSIEIKGHLEALIELGAGFHPLLTGRENIQQRVSMLNLSPEERKKIEAEIIEFSDVGEFIDMPFKNYSSGMQARLGFSCAILSKPDVLLVDEVLSVGDFEFQQKCLSKINALRSSTAIVIVSHNLQTLSLFCDRGVIIQRGKVVKVGPILDCIKFHMEDQKDTKHETIIDLRGNEFLNKDFIESFSLSFENVKGETVTSYCDEDIFLNINIAFKAPPGPNIYFGIPIWHQDGTKISSLNSDQDRIELPIVENVLKTRIQIKNTLNTGNYLLCFALVRGVEFLFRHKLPIIKVMKFHPREHGYFSLNYNLLKD